MVEEVKEHGTKGTKGDRFILENDASNLLRDIARAETNLMNLRYKRVG